MQCMIGPAKIYFIIFGLLTIVGGVIGYVKAGSTASIIAGSISGIALIVAAFLLPGNVGARAGDRGRRLDPPRRPVHSRFHENRRGDAGRVDVHPERDRRHHGDRRLDKKITGLACENFVSGRSGFFVVALAGRGPDRDRPALDLARAMASHPAHAGDADRDRDSREKPDAGRPPGRRSSRANSIPRGYLAASRCRPRSSRPRAGAASDERADPQSYVLELKLRARIPTPNSTIEDLAKVSPELPRLLPGLAAMVTPESVSPFFKELYDTKVKNLKEDLVRLDQLLSRHNFYDCQTVLQLRHPETKRRAVLLQADMDVDADGSDSDRLPGRLRDIDQFQAGHQLSLAEEEPDSESLPRPGGRTIETLRNGAGGERHDRRAETRLESRDRLRRATRSRC